MKKGRGVGTFGLPTSNRINRASGPNWAESLSTRLVSGELEPDRGRPVQQIVEDPSVADETD